MRAILALSAVLVLAAQTTSGAQAAYAERRGLLELNARCRLVSAGVAAALEAGAGQAAGALLRDGWTLARLGELDQAAVAAARQRPCNDPRTTQAVHRARRGFATFASTHAMTFPGGARNWSARRTPDPQGGWMLSQALPGGARFGVRSRSGAEELALVLPRSGRMPGGAQLMLRDVRRAPRSLMDLPGRTARGLEAGAPAAGAARAFTARARLVEPQQTAFLYDGAALALMTHLDPRESVRVVFPDGRPDLLIEVGDIAAARTFLTLRPER